MTTVKNTNISLSAFIWTVADLLRGDYKRADFGKVILPFTLLRRMDCVLNPTKSQAISLYQQAKSLGVDPFLFVTNTIKQPFCNFSELDLKSSLNAPNHLKSNLITYINSFSSNISDIFDLFEFDKQLEKLDNAKLLFLVTQKFEQINLHPNVVSNADMGIIFEELIRKFAEESNETAGEHFTPREVIRLMVDLLFVEDHQALSKPGIIRTIYDPTAGTGGMLSVAEEYLKLNNPNSNLIVYGQELNGESYAICKADMLIKGQNISNIKFGNTLSNDGHSGDKFDYGISNPPFGVEWKKVEKKVRDEHERLGLEGRFGPGLPRVSDGSLLFLLHLISKMKAPQDGGSRIAIVLNGSPLFTGGAGSGESDIRKYIFENDLLETIIGLPNDLFYNTGIATYIWILSNHKSKERKGKIQLINAVDMYQKMRKSLGSKRNEISQKDIDEIVKVYGNFKETKISKIFDNTDFGYSTITVERPLRDENGNIVLTSKGKQKDKPQADPNLRDTENVPLKDNIKEYFNREVLPHAPDAWIDEEKTKVGYEIPFNRHFYEHTKLRDLEDIDRDLTAMISEIQALLSEVIE